MSLQLVIVTGMSGAGKSTALKMFEDMDFFCIDNLPISLISKVVQLTLEGEEGKISRIALGIDSRNREGLQQIRPVLKELEAQKINYKILFLDAQENILVKRYKETRRSHPMAKGDRLEKGIQKERVQMAFLKEKADYILDTRQLLNRDLRAELERIFLDQADFRNLMVTILSFGFKYGIPADSDLVFDVRFLPNPYYVPELRDLTGLDQKVVDFVMAQEVSKQFVKKLVDMLRFLIPYYIQEGKNQLVISIGCTGGKHRSVTLARELYHFLGQDASSYGLRIEHRDVYRDNLRKEM